MTIEQHLNELGVIERPAIPQPKPDAQPTRQPQERPGKWWVGDEPPF